MRLNKNLIFFISLNFIIFSIQSQNFKKGSEFQTPNFFGNIIDIETKKPLEFVTISVYNQSDSTLVNGGITDLDGKFKLSLKPGKYYAKVQFISYKDYIIENIEITNQKFFTAGQIILEPNFSELNEVVISAEKTQMQLQLDKKVFNIGTDLSNLAGNASDILNNLPSVQVDLDGNVSLRGSQNVRILINGKPSGLTGLSSSDALRQIPSNLIEKVEIITNPSARYDAEGLSGIINIILKKEANKGVNGSYQVNVGYPTNYQGSVNMNFRSEKINWFTNIGTGYRKSPGTGKATQQFYLQDTTYSTTRTNDRLRGGLNYNIQFGADWYITPKTILTNSFLYRFSDEDNNTENKYLDYDSKNILNKNTLREDKEIDKDNNLQYALNFTQNFERENHKLTFDIQYQDNSEIEKSTINEKNEFVLLNTNKTLNQKSLNDAGESNLLIQSDYFQPLTEDSKMEFGFRLSDRNVRNNYLVEEENDLGVYEKLTQYSNDFEYNEQILAFYGIYGNKFNNLTYQLGIRHETSTIETILKNTNENNTLNYNNFFPSINLTYKLGEVYSLQTSYSKRIRRPNFRSLNPFYSFSDARNLFTGNPKLQPEFTDSYEFGLLQNYKSNSFYYAIYYRFTEGLVQRISTVDDKGITFIKPYNLSTGDDWGIEVNSSVELLKFITINGNVNVFKSIIHPPSDQPNLKTEFFSFSARMSNRFKISQNSSTQLNFFYLAPQKTTQGERLSMYSVDLGYSLDILNKNGTIAFNVTDLFNTRKYRGTSEGETFKSESEFQWRARQFNLSFTYRLNQKKQRDRGGRGNNNEGGDDGF